MSHRGVFVNFDGEQVEARLYGHAINLQRENCCYYVKEAYQGPVDPAVQAELAKLALAGTIDIDQPDNPDTKWGFVTEDSLRRNGHPIE